MSDNRTWGNTGRVTIRYPGRESGIGVQYEVRVDGVISGHVIAPWEFINGWAWRLIDGWVGDDGRPNIDHAVMALLRRAAPKVWRAERPVVWSVRAHRVPTDAPPFVRWRWTAAPGRRGDWAAEPPLFSGESADPGDRAWIRLRADARAREAMTEVGP